MFKGAILRNLGICLYQKEKRKHVFYCFSKEAQCKYFSCLRKYKIGSSFYLPL